MISLLLLCLGATVISAATPRIINGDEANPGEFPFMIMILKENNGSWSSAGCGASLMHDDLVLTKAHCVKGKEDKIDGVYINAYSPWNNNGDQKWTMIRVADRMVHPMYESSSNTFDIAVLRLETTVQDAMAKKYGEEFRNVIQPVKVNHYLEDESLSILTVIGFGRTSENGEKAEVLQKVDVDFVSPTDCEKIYTAAGHQVLPNMICAAVDGVKDACQGDSGGPLLLRLPNTEEYIQIGVVSWGIGCARAGFPGVYARVRPNIAWIKQTACPDSQSSTTGFCYSLATRRPQPPVSESKKSQRIGRGNGGGAGGQQRYR